jgi:hypothetical protein
MDPRAGYDTFVDEIVTKRLYRSASLRGEPLVMALQRRSTSYYEKG